MVPFPHRTLRPVPWAPGVPRGTTSPCSFRTSVLWGGDPLPLRLPIRSRATPNFRPCPSRVPYVTGTLGESGSHGSRGSGGTGDDVLSLVYRKTELVPVTRDTVPDSLGGWTPMGRPSPSNVPGGRTGYITPTGLGPPEPPTYRTRRGSRLPGPAKRNGKPPVVESSFMDLKGSSSGVVGSRDSSLFVPPFPPGNVGESVTLRLPVPSGVGDVSDGVPTPLVNQTNIPTRTPKPG